MSEIFSNALQGEVDAGRAADLDDAGRRYVEEYRPTSLLGRPTMPDEVLGPYLCSYFAPDVPVLVATFASFTVYAP